MSAGSPDVEAALQTLRELARGVRPRPGSIRRSASGLRIDNPGARGALTVGMMVELAEHVLELQSDPPGVVRIEGVDGAFCSGGHLGQVRESLLEPGAGLAMAHAMTAVLDGLATLPSVVVAVIDGPALGGGAELATAADHRLIGPAGRVGFVHGRLGVAPGWGGAARLERQVGYRTALRLLTTAAVVDGEEAVGLGLADATGPLESIVADFLEPLRDVGTEALHAAKRQLLAAHPIRRDGTEAALFAEVWGSAAHRRALR